MPAIDLARLKKQTAQLADLFDQPADFLRELKEILDYYVNRTLRSQGVAPSSVLPTYRTPSVVLRQIETELSPVAEKNPIEALELADALWDEGWLETRLLAAFLLGTNPSARGTPARATHRVDSSHPRPGGESRLTDDQPHPSTKRNAGSVSGVSQRVVVSHAPTHVVERIAGARAAHRVAGLRQSAAHFRNRGTSLQSIASRVTIRLTGTSGRSSQSVTR
jgi:hypothetical protein